MKLEEGGISQRGKGKRYYISKCNLSSWVVVLLYIVLCVYIYIHTYVAFPWWSTCVRKAIWMLSYIVPFSHHNKITLRLYGSSLGFGLTFFSGNLQVVCWLLADEDERREKDSAQQSPDSWLPLLNALVILFILMFYLIYIVVVLFAFDF